MIYGGQEPPRNDFTLNVRTCPPAKTDTEIAEDAELEKIVASFFETESFGVRPAPRKWGKGDERAREILSKTTRHTGTR